jgi:diphthamide synthase subunit DPH2
VLYRLQPPDLDDDHRELVERNLIEKVQRDGEQWWKVRFNQVDGPSPTFKMFANLNQEFDAVGNQIVSWIHKDGVKPRDICVIYNSRLVKQMLNRHVAPKLTAIGARLVVQTGQTFNLDDRSVLATTSQSFKGYDSEVVVIPGVDQFVAIGLRFRRPMLFAVDRMVQ